MRKRSSGFTLVELLVVIGIISLLISILLPSLSKARNAAKTVLCLSNLRQIGLGLSNYAVDNQGQFPPPAGIFFGYFGQQQPWDLAIYKYLGGHVNWDTTASFPPAGLNVGIFRCPFDDNEIPPGFTFGFPINSYEVNWGTNNDTAGNYRPFFAFTSSTGDFGLSGYGPNTAVPNGGRWSATAFAVPASIGPGMSTGTGQFVMVADYLVRAPGSSARLWGVDTGAVGWNQFVTDADNNAFQPLGHPAFGGVDGSSLRKSQRNCLFNDGHCATLLAKLQLANGNYAAEAGYFYFDHR